MSELRISVDMVDWLSGVSGRADVMRDITLGMVDQYEAFACQAQEADAELADLSDVGLAELVDLAQSSAVILAASQQLLLDAIANIRERVKRGVS